MELNSLSLMPETSTPSLSNLAKWFRRGSHFNEKVYGQTDGHHDITVAGHEHYVLRWAKTCKLNNKIVILTDRQNICLSEIVRPVM